MVADNPAAGRWPRLAKGNQMPDEPLAREAFLSFNFLSDRRSDKKWCDKKLTRCKQWFVLWRVYVDQPWSVEWGSAQLTIPLRALTLGR